MEYDGCVDRMTEFEIFGWAVARDSADMVSVDLVINGKVADTARACHFREDVKSAGISDGYSGFHFASCYILPWETSDVRIVYSGTDITVPNGQRSIHFSGEFCEGEVEVDLPDELYAGEGTFFFCSGWVFNTLSRVKQLTVRIGEYLFAVEHINQPRDDVTQFIMEKGLDKTKTKNVFRSGFYGMFELPPGLEGFKGKVQFEAVFENGNKFLISEKDIYFLKKEEYFLPLPITENAASQGPMVAICMAVYSPDTSSFRRQIDSIKNQSYQNWICIISDDGSEEDAVSTVRDIISDDSRFYLVLNEMPNGFYKNFENALRYVPDRAEYVAFADQDDDWYPHKLERLVSEIHSDPRLNLVYSDMNIVGKNGDIISETYWMHRKNYYHSLPMILVANTVTGAASVFRRVLLKQALPFPQKLGNVFHDHMMACAALAYGRIGYIDEPLYDYIQYDSSFIGHCDFRSEKNIKIRDLVFNIMNTSYMNEAIRFFLKVYIDDYARLGLLTKTMTLRDTENDVWPELFDNSFLSVLKLLLMHIKIKMTRQTTNDAEMKLALSVIAKKYLCGFFADQR